MSKPDKPRWADTVEGDSTKVDEPLSAKKDIGWEAEKPPFQYMNWLFLKNYQWADFLEQFVESNEPIVMRSDSALGWDGSNITFSDNIEISFRVPGAEQINHIASADSPISMSDGDVLLFIKDRVNSSPVALSSGTYGTLSDGEYVVVSEASLSDSNYENETILFRRRGTELELPQTGEIYDSGATVYLGRSQDVFPSGVKLNSGERLVVDNDEGADSYFVHTQSPNASLALYLEGILAATWSDQYKALILGSIVQGYDLSLEQGSKLILDGAYASIGTASYIAMTGASEMSIYVGGTQMIKIVDVFGGTDYVEIVDQLKVDSIDEVTSGNGVEIDGLTIKGGLVGPTTILWNYPYKVVSDLSLSGTSQGNGDITAMSQNRLAIIDVSSNEIQAYSFDGSAWSPDGSAFSVSGSYNFPALTSLSNSEIAYFDEDNEELRKYTFNGSTWSLTGSAFTLPTNIMGNLCAMNDSDVAVVDNTNSTLGLYRFNGSTWSLIGALKTSVAGYSITSLTSTDVAIADPSSNELKTFRFNGSVWTQVGNVFSLPSSSSPQICSLNYSDVAYVDNSEEILKIYRFDGTDWSLASNDFYEYAFDIGGISTLNGTDIVGYNGGSITPVPLLSTFRFGFSLQNQNSPASGSF